MRKARNSCPQPANNKTPQAALLTAPLAPSLIPHFKNIIYSHYEEAGRMFPWRGDITPWGVLVSEFMLQQTQTERVIPYWERWMSRWSTPEALSKASMEEALREWSGLGYNRRCRYLKECARLITEQYGGQVPDTPAELLHLPGIGAYTSGAIACFSYNYPAVFIETNIRAVVIHFFFQAQEAVKDTEIIPILEATLDRENPRKWYWALMDYGAALKKVTVNPSRRSAHYTKQSRFEGSFRQLRGSIIKSLVTQGPANAGELHTRIGVEEMDLYEALKALEKESMVAEEEGVYKIPDTQTPQNPQRCSKTALAPL
ncbi:MAG: A/G-specific adenine glycosylase [Treponema sp.]|jgi:A/G-specific adenine glycosylase|nr:A/G-specific adenine glycosylase [Treponema sp.]